MLNRDINNQNTSMPKQYFDISTDSANEVALTLPFVQLRSVNLVWWICYGTAPTVGTLGVESSLTVMNGIGIFASCVSFIFVDLLLYKILAL